MRTSNPYYGKESISGTDLGELGSAFVARYFAEEIGGSYMVKLNSYNGRIHHVLKASALTSNNWSSITGPQGGPGGGMSDTDTARVSPTNPFYKIQVTRPLLAGEK